MQIADLIDEGRVLIDLQVPDKARLLQALSKHAARFAAVGESEIAAALLAREALGTTGMGGGIAIPHARIGGVTRSLGLFARLKSPIDYDSVDGRPVDLVFLLLLPADLRGEQLQALACVSRCLRNPLIAAELRKKADVAATFGALSAGS